MRVLMMAGGTGGHVFPALSVANRLRELGAEIVWIGTTQGIEARLVPDAGYPIEWLAVAGLRGKGWLAKLAAPFLIVRASWQALRIVKRVDPDLVVGMGGFASGPGGLAAWLLRLPLLIHEQNAAPGMTNRILSRLAAVVLEAFPNTFDTATATVGNPVRPELLALPAPADRLTSRGGRGRLLVVGGSQGALPLNKLVPAALASMGETDRPDVWHQAGHTIEIAREAYSQFDSGQTGEIRLVEFIEDMAEAYAWADLVVCRSGALTVAELAAVGIASILIPFPYAVDDHQTRNAAYLVESGAAQCIQQSELNAEMLAARIRALLADRAQLLDMAQSARRCAWPASTDSIVDHCQRLAGAAA